MEHTDDDQMQGAEIVVAISEDDPMRVAVWELGIKGYLADPETGERYDPDRNLLIVVPILDRITLEEVFRIIHATAKGDPSYYVEVISE